MLFYIGIHKPNHAINFERCFISINVLRRRVSDFAVNNWILDSGAFTELSQHGQYIHTVHQYADEINRWANCGNLELAVTQDYMCEPFILEKTGLSVERHQQLTINRYDTLVSLTKIPIMPVLQGYQIGEYMRHLNMYGNRIKKNMRVGVGSVCKRNTNTQTIAQILSAIKGARPDIKLHGFGLKTTSLSNAYIESLLYSADSMAWSYEARRNGGNANGLHEAQLFLNKVTSQKGRRPHQLSYRIE